MGHRRLKARPRGDALGRGRRPRQISLNCLSTARPASLQPTPCFSCARTRATISAARCADARSPRRSPTSTRTRRGRARTWAATGSPPRWCCCRTVLPTAGSRRRMPASSSTNTCQGNVVETYFRGRTSISHVIQAAQSFARRATGDDRIDTFLTLAHEHNAVLTRMECRSTSRRCSHHRPDA